VAAAPCVPDAFWIVSPLTVHPAIAENVIASEFDAEPPAATDPKLACCRDAIVAVGIGDADTDVGEPAETST